MAGSEKTGELAPAITGFHSQLLASASIGGRESTGGVVDRGEEKPQRMSRGISRTRCARLDGVSRERYFRHQALRAAEL